MMALPGSGGATGAAAAGRTATTVGVGDGATSDAAANVGAADANDRATGLGDSGSTAGCTSESAATLARCTVCVTSLSDDGVGSDDGVLDDAGVGFDAGVGSGEAVPVDGVGVVGATTSGPELADSLVAVGVDEAGVLS